MADYVETTRAGPTQPGGGRPLNELLVELWQNTEKLVRQEAQLASAELEGKLAKAKRDLTAAAIGGAILYAGMLALIAAAILLLSHVLVAWLAALIVGVVVAGIGFSMMRKAKELDGEALMPRQTIDSVKHDVRTFKEAMR